MQPKRSDRLMLPSLGIVLGGALWGLVWLPLRALGELGLHGAWPGAMIYAGSALCLLPLLVMRHRQLARQWRTLTLCGLTAGAAFSLYSTSLLLTEVVRAVLLFYLTPVWGTLLGIAVLDERLGASRLLGLVLGIAGLMVVLGIGVHLPWPANLGDWLALASGLLWALASLFLYRSENIAVPDQVISFTLGSLAVTLVSIALGGAAFGGAVALGKLAEVLPWGMLAALHLLPMLVLTIWPAMLLTPGRVGLLLMSDVIVGVASAALWAGEPFGLREIAGTLLIVAAAVIEVLGQPVEPAAGT